MLINCLEFDILGISETHLINDQVLDVDGFTWFGNNRKGLHKRAKKRIRWDFNARCAVFQDFIAGVDIIPERQVIDFTVNRHGELLCEFLVDTNCCMLNGRSPDMSANEFTCIRSLGSSVVDYCLVPHEDLDKFTDFKVCKISELINKSEILNTLDANTSKPDHSILTWRADFGYIYESCSKTS